MVYEYSLKVKDVHMTGLRGILTLRGNAYMDYADKIFNSETFKNPGEVI